jgi:uncharacterized membrane protein YsdA (DUF1294 family)
MDSLLVTLVRYCTNLGIEAVLFYAWLVFVGINLTAFALFGIDKRRSVNGQWRVREKTLLQIAFFGGWAGAYAGRSYFRHKTRKQPFCTRLAAASIGNVVLVSGLGIISQTL